MGGLTTCEECDVLASRLVPFVLADISPAQLRDACGADPEFACREILERTESVTAAEVADVVFGTPLTIVLILIGAWIVNRLVRRAIARGLRGLGSTVVRERVSAVRRRAPGLPPSETPEATLRAERRLSALTSILRSVAGFVILLFAIFMVLSEIGIDVAPLLAGAGVIGVALGFGSQSLVKDFLSGMFILVEDQFGVDDVVELDGGTRGTVEAVSLRTTRLRAEDGTVWYVPNGTILRVGNRSQHWSRTVIEIEVAPDTDDEHARRCAARVAHALCRDSEDLLEEPEVLEVERREPRALAVRLAVKALTADHASITSELLERLRAEFAREGIELAQAPEPDSADASEADVAVEAEGSEPVAQPPR